MKLKIEVLKNQLLQVLIPEHIKKCVIVNYGYAGTWLMESNSTELNAWKMKLPNGKYEIIGRIEDIIIDTDDLSEIETDKNYILRRL